MMRYTQKDVIGIGFTNNYKPEEFENHEDIYNETMNHIESSEGRKLEMQYIEEDSIVRECDYCGKLLMSKKYGNNTRMYSNNYIDKDSEYPCTDDSCMDCSGEKKRMIFFQMHGVTVNVNAFKTKAKNGKVPSSRPQIYLSKLLKGKHNPYFKNVGYLDIVIEENKLIIEYDGSGHFAGIHYGRYTYEEKLKLDYERDMKAKELGYKIIRISSPSDLLPSDEEIINKVESIKKKFTESNSSFYRWEIPTNQKNKDFNKLRKITEEDISWHRKQS